MKRTKPDQTVISLASKRQSLQQDRLTAVHHSELNPPLQTVDANHNKSFFANMKAELSNIRSDYQRLIQREEKASSLSIKEKQVIQQKATYGTAEKMKSHSSYKQEDRYLTQKKLQPEQSSKNKQTTEPPMKGFNVGKNLNEAVNFKNRHISGREKEPSAGHNPVSKYIALQVKEEEAKEQNYTSVNSKKYSSKFNQGFSEKELLLQRIQLQRQKDFMNKLQQEIAIYKLDANRSKTQLSRITEQNKILKQKIDALQKEMTEKAEQVKIDDQILAKYKSIVGKIQQNEKAIAQKDKLLAELQEQRNKQRHFLEEKINQLTFYNNKFYNDNIHLVEQNHQLKEIIANLQKINEDNQRLAAQSENECQRKLDHLEKNLKQYEKRESMFQKEIQRLCLQINTQTSFPIQGSIHNGSTQQISFETAEKIRVLECQLSKQKEINQIISQKYKSQLQKLNIQGITTSLQQTIQRLTDQNAQLKRQLNSLTSKVSSLQEQNNAYSAEIKLYEERDKAMQVNRSLTSSQWEDMTEKIEYLQAENKRLSEEQDYKQLLQDVIAQRSVFSVAFEIKEEFETVLRTAKDQLQQIQKLKIQVEKLENKLRICDEERKEAISHKLQLEDQLKTFLSCENTSQNIKIMQKCDQLRNQLEQKEKQLRKVKQFMRSSFFPERDDTEFY